MMIDALRIAVNAADNKKAHDLVALDISGIASFTNYFLFCTGDSSRQMQAIADEVEKRLKASGIRPSHIEGYQNSEWILMDYIDLVVHIFSRSARAYYDLERLWRDGKKLDIEKLLEEAKPAPRKRKVQ
ncbi:MAG: ribosome silencing factor [Acidobacteria bacterium]|nr:ribosome silencing factor [Acidobacteriota bacterium]